MNGPQSETNAQKNQKIGGSLLAHIRHFNVE